MQQTKTCTSCGETKSSKGFNYLTCGDCRKKKYRASKGLPEWENRTPGDVLALVKKPRYKNCRSCMRDLPREQFLFDAPIELISSHCRDCRLIQHKEAPYKLGLSYENRQKMIEWAGGVCQICGSPERILGHRLSIDHCHETGRIRGVLCRTHNMAIGGLSSVELLDSAKRYFLAGELSVST